MYVYSYIHTFTLTNNEGGNKPIYRTNEMISCGDEDEKLKEAAAAIEPNLS